MRTERELMHLLADYASEWDLFLYYTENNHEDLADRALDCLAYFEELFMEIGHECQDRIEKGDI